ncbi:MAG: glycosyltransferase family 39 protein [Bryobacterales bacterium]|nr:glycosyltransferase family 39 protein [Bryobacteraceae bacterium]MDW8353356.1 glycosyltransferase family 39 protein [Bryobacterales bacterium]
MSGTRDLLVVVGAVLLLRLPFLDHPIQGDDIYYLAGAQHAQIEPLHPNHARYVFQGEVVAMQGHPHPPLNAWFLGALLALLGDIREVPFHAAYISFSLIAALATLSLARRFTRRPILATLLFLATPAFVVNGTSLEADVPFVSLWLASTALFVSAVEESSRGKLVAAGGALFLAALTAYQSALLVPVLATYVWLRRRTYWAAWGTLAVIPATLVGWQLWERFSTGEMPLAVLGGYFQTYGLQRLHNKLHNALALAVHAAWLVFPGLARAAFRGPRWWIAAGLGAGAAWFDPHPLFWGSFALGALVLAWCAGAVRSPDWQTRFLCAWVLLFFAGALVLFFAGAARYLLPIAAPVALLAVRRLENRPGWLAAGFSAQMGLSLALAWVNYQHWDGYRRFAQSLRKETETHRVWINGEWGLRFYFEADGGLPLLRGQAVRPGEFVVTSDLAYPIEFTTGGGVLAPVLEKEIRPRLPLRLIGLGARSGYSSASLGLRPFDLSTAPVDRVRWLAVRERKPELSWLPMNAPEAPQQIVSGIYQLEDNRFRWMGERAVVLLKNPGRAAPLHVSLYVPEQAPGRRVSLSVDGVTVAEETYPAPGSYTLVSRPVSAASEQLTVVIAVDRTFSVPGDQRRLGLVLVAVGFPP